MKNKTKKILAAACLGFVGAGCLTGCALNEDQKAALDLITEKSDEIIMLLEDNMKLTNSKLSKQEAYEKIMLAINKLTVGMLDQVHISRSGEEYEGVFDKLNESHSRKYDAYYRKEGDKKIIATLEDGEFQEIMVSDFGVNNHYAWENGQDSLQERTYRHSDFLISKYDISSDAGLDEITPDDIYDIVVKDETYEFKVFYQSSVETGLMEVVVSKDGYLLQVNYTGLEISDSGHGSDSYKTYNSYLTTVIYEYDNIDFSVVDAKLNELQV